MTTEPRALSFPSEASLRPLRRSTITAPPPARRRPAVCRVDRTVGRAGLVKQSTLERAGPWREFPRTADGAFDGVVVQQLVAVAHNHAADTFEAYFEAVLDEVFAASGRFEPEIHAVEGVVAPTPHLGTVAVTPLLEIAQLVGALRFFGFRVVRPAGFGKVPDLPQGPVLDAFMASEYPQELISRREVGGAYGGRLRHARSAYQLAGAAVVQTRQQALFGCVR